MAVKYLPKYMENDTKEQNFSLLPETSKEESSVDATSETSTENSSDDTQKEEHKKPWQWALLTILGLAIIIGGAYYYFTVIKTETQGPNYAQAYALSSYSISKSANIKINLPSDSDKELARAQISFEPEIKGDWVDTEEDDTLVFDPEETMDVGKYYTVSLNTPDGVMGHDFKVEEDPEVLAVFPNDGTEAHENSDITVIFNRPMVPLTTLDVMYEQSVPIEIQPATPGKYKWIGTRSLQFIPEDTLVGSANYSVKVKSDFVSLDGLNIDNFEHKFTTRHLRYEFTTNSSLLYNRPITIRFNQPVDKDRTVAEITVKTLEENSRKVDFIAEYGTKWVWNRSREENVEETDYSTILLYQKEDKFGRRKLWDFETDYEYTVNKAYPAKGDINIDEVRTQSFNVGKVISSITAQSDRSSFVTPSFFDPEGKLWVSFQEEIDLKRSDIEARDLVDIGYGEKCKNENDEASYGSDIECQKVDNKQWIYLKFDAGKLNNSDAIVIAFEKIRNADNLLLNPETLTETINIIPKLNIHDTSPKEGSANNSLTKFVLCSNTPLVQPAKEDIDNYFNASKDYEFNIWRNSYRINHDKSRNSFCGINNFATELEYGLMPETDYEVNIKVEDQFGEKAEIKRSFKTGRMPDKYLNFYHYQKRYNVTSPGKTGLAYSATNMEYVDFNICKTDAVNMLRKLDDKPDYRDDSSVYEDICSETVAGRIELPKRYWVKNNFKFNIQDYFEDTKGYYIITFSNPDYNTNYRDEIKLVHERTYLTVSNYGVVEKKVNYESRGNNDENLDDELSQHNNVYWVVNLSDMSSVADAKVNVYRDNYDNETFPVFLNSVYTNSEGLAYSKPSKDVVGVEVVKDGDSTIILDADNDLDEGSIAYLNQKIYTYTDRPIYRPGHEVFIKGIYRVGYDGNYEIPADKKVTVKIRNSNYEEVLNKEIEINDYGTFDTSFVIDSQAPLGRYSINVDSYGYTSFEVEEYVPAAFKVEAKTDKEEYISGETVNIDIDSTYYFGAPVEGGKVEYSINSQDYYFDKYEGEYFMFGKGWYYCYWDCDYGDKFVLRNNVEFGNDGKANISQAIDIDKLFKNDDDKASKIFTVNYTVWNDSGQSISGRKSFIVHLGDYYLGVKSDKSFMSKGEDFKVKVKSVDIKGADKQVDDIKLTINKLEWVHNKRQEVDGGYYYKWETKRDKILEKEFDTDRSGNWDDDFSIDNEGQYEIVVEGYDEKGNKIKSVYKVYVWGEGLASVRPTNDTTLELEADKTGYRSGDTAGFVIKSPFKKAKALISIERGGIYEHKIVDVNQSIYKHEFEIKEKYIPNVYASVVLVSAEGPEIKYGKLNFGIDTIDKELDIEVTSNKTNYLPGEDVELSFKVKDMNGNPVETELSAAVADLSVLALKGNPKKNPVVFFYNWFPLTITTASNMTNILYEVDVPVGTKGGGGSESEDLAKKKRGEFKDTAFWQAVIRTDKNGEARVKFTLPDNLTTWQIESLGITKDTKLGVDYNEFIARKDLMVVPLKPRFIIPGDEFMIGAKVFNQTDGTEKFKVTLESDSLEFLEDANESIKLDAGQTETLYFKVKAPENKLDGRHVFEVSAKNDEYEDTVENLIVIRRNDTYETTATAGFSTDDREKEFIFVPGDVSDDRGGLTVNHSATLAVFLSDSLDYLFSYPYGCTEQAASKLDAIAIAKKGLNLENIGDKYEERLIEFEGEFYTIDEVVKMGLARMYENQLSDGGFGYYSWDESGYYLTLHVVEVLNNLDEAGFEVDDGRLKKAVSYLVSYMNSPARDQDYWNVDDYIFGAHTLSTLSEKYQVDLGSKVKGKIEALRGNDEKLVEDMSSLALGKLALILTSNEDEFGSDFKEAVIEHLENRVEIDSRGAFIGAGERTYWRYYETPIKNTGIYLKVLAANERDTEITHNVIRWMLRSRAKDGSWGTTNNTVTAIDAMTDYLIWKRENESNFTLKIDVDDENKSAFTYGPENILTQNSFSMGINEFEFDKISPVVFNREKHNDLENKYYYDMSLKYFLPIDTVAPRDEGFTVTRSFYDLGDSEYEEPISKAKVGDVLKGRIEIIVPKDRNFVAIEDFIPAGVELVNFDFATEGQSLLQNTSGGEEMYDESDSSGYWRYGYDETGARKLYARQVELRDDRLFIFAKNLRPDTYYYEYYVRVQIPGKFHHLPAVASEMYEPENFGRTRGDWFEVVE